MELMSEEQLSLPLAEEQGTVQQAPMPSPADTAAAFFSMEMPRLNNLLSQMSVKQMRRVVMNTIAYPLTERFKLVTDIEKRAAYLYSELARNRMIMELTLEMERAEKAQQIKEENEANKTNNSNNEGELKNGETT